jgi:hypothetical protein
MLTCSGEDFVCSDSGTTTSCRIPRVFVELSSKRWDDPNIFDTNLAAAAPSSSSG